VASVFLSYRQGDAPHTQRVRELALKLRAAGLTVTHDGLHNEEQWHMGGPPEGWLNWSYAQIDANDKVLLIGSASYYQVYEDKAPPGVGVGAAIEARRIFQKLAKAKGQNPRFRLVVLALGDDTGIPDHLDDYHRFKPNDLPTDFAALVTWLKAPVAGAAPTPALPTPTAPTSATTSASFPAAPVTVDRQDFVDCRRAFEAFEQMLVAGAPKRILLLEGHGNHGKSKLLNLLFHHTRSLLGSTSVARVELKEPTPSPDMLLRDIARSLHLPLPVGGNSSDQTHALLDACRDRPVVVFIDVYDDHIVANPEYSYWVNLFLSHTLDDSNLRCVVAGRRAPARDAQPWEVYAVHTPCDAMQDKDAVLEYARKHGYSGPPEGIETLRTVFLRRRQKGSDQMNCKVLFEEIRDLCPVGTTLS
jgi:hypothetical protein